MDQRAKNVIYFILFKGRKVVSVFYTLWDVFGGGALGCFGRGNVLKHEDSSVQYFCADYSRNITDGLQGYRDRCLKRMPLANFLMKVWRKSVNNLESSQKGERKKQIQGGLHLVPLYLGGESKCLVSFQVPIFKPIEREASIILYSFISAFFLYFSTS